MPQIRVRNLVRTFRVAERDPGAWGAVKGLFHRRYRTVRALNGVSFDIDQGELVGYIGPNGAGKSTTVKILSGILVPTSGECRVLGLVPWQQRSQLVRQLGVVFGQRTQLWWDLPVIESFDLLRRIYRVPDPAYQAMRDRMVDLLDLAPLLDTPVRQLSLGQRMRCDLAAALLHQPRILYLDEPTIGLDAVSKLAVREFVQEIVREHGVTVILTTHDMDDIEALCRRVLLINRGQILIDGTLDDLRRQVRATRRVIIELAQPGLTVADDDAVVVSQTDARVELAYDPQRVAAADLVARLCARYPIRDLTIENEPIERVIARLYRQEEAPAPAVEAP